MLEPALNGQYSTENNKGNKKLSHYMTKQNAVFLWMVTKKNPLQWAS